MLYSTKNNQQDHSGAFLYLIQVKVVLFTIISAASYYWVLSSTPFEVIRGSYSYM